MHAYKPVRSEEYFYFNCSKCGECCRNIKDTVLIDSLDLYRIAKFLKIEMSEATLKYTGIVFLSWGFPVLMLKTMEDRNSCVFLKSSKCSIQPVKPRACRLYPLGVGPDDNNNDELLNFIVSEKEHHFTGTRILAGSWINKNLTQEDRDFIVDEYNHTRELGRLMRKIDRRHGDKVSELNLFFKYIAYDGSESFQTQYARNMRQLKTNLNLFAGK